MWFLLAVVFPLLRPMECVVNQGSGLPGTPCVQAGGVTGTCEEVRACVRGGGVVSRNNEVQLCQSGGHRDDRVYVCCRNPHKVAKELCEAWSEHWRPSGGGCVTETPLIVGGEEADVGEFPHMALLGKKYRDEPITYECAGTLVSPYHVLTAAHCVVDYWEGLTYWVKLGEHDRSSSTQLILPRANGPIPSSLYRSDFLKENKTLQASQIEQEIEVDDVLLHPNYPRTRYFYSDIALVRLKTPAVLTKRVLPACLPQDPKEDYLNRNLTVVGWGYTQAARQLSEVPMKALVPVVDRLTCSAIIGDLFNIPQGIVYDQICAGKEGRDSCQGDSGGPLLYRRPRNDGSLCEWEVAGIVSFGIGQTSMCGKMGVYTRVSSYLDWVTSIIAPHNTATDTSLDSSESPPDNSPVVLSWL